MPVMDLSRTTSKLLVRLLQTLSPKASDSQSDGSGLPVRTDGLKSPREASIFCVYLNKIWWFVN